MVDAIRSTLRDLVEQYGPSLADDPWRVAALLRDLAGPHRLEISLIETAAEEGIAAELRDIADGELPPERLEQLTRQLRRNRGLAREGARWAVKAWALALDVAVAATTPSPFETPLAEAPSLMSLSALYERDGDSAQKRAYEDAMRMRRE